MTEITYGSISEEGLTKMKASFGRVYRPYRAHEVATKDAIRHFADAVGDPNPLWRDPSYARESKYGCIVSPPFFSYAVAALQRMEGLPGVHAFHCATEWEWFDVIRENDEIIVEDVPTDLVEKTGKIGGRQYLQVGKTYYYVRGKLVAVCKGKSMRVERKKAREKGKDKHIKLQINTEKDLEKIYQAIEKEERRGNTPRYWEEVNINDELVPVVKGPLGMEDMIAWYVGTAAPHFAKAHELRLEYLRKHPAWTYHDPETGAVGQMSAVHERTDLTDSIGLAGPYDLAVQRFSWIGHLICNWMGDDGFLKKVKAECRMFNYFGDTQYLKGRIVNKYTDKGQYFVDIEIRTENQRGENTMPGMATVMLPSLSRGRE
jgi:acyl dehydratase